MKGIIRFLAGAAIVLLAAGTALAIPTDPNVKVGTLQFSGYSWVNAPLWTSTDRTSDFEMRVERFGTGQDSSFGLYYVDDNNVIKTFTILDPDAGQSKHTVKFTQTGSNFQVSLDAGAWKNFSNTFGFYFDVTTGKTSSYYSDYSLDTDGKTTRNVWTAADSASNILIFLDQELKDSGFKVLISGDDLTPAAVPEPGTMVLLGAGLLSLAIYGKRRNNREA